MSIELVILGFGDDVKLGHGTVSHRFGETVGTDTVFHDGVWGVS